MKYSNKLSHVIKQGDSLYKLAQYYNTTVQEILAQNPQIDPYNLQIGSMITIFPDDQFTMQENQSSSVYTNTNIQPQLSDKMRKVWEQHIYWTRMLLISIAERLKDQKDVANRLLENPSDIARIFSNYYTTDIANTIAKLLTEHLKIGAALITALRDGRRMEAENLKSKWYLNADQMANAFSSINPYYNREDVRNMLYKHLDLTTQEVAMRLAGNYPADINAFDLVEQEALKMADYFSQGIMQQFPQKFR